MGKLRSLEMLRAVAALLVVLFHTQVIFEHRAGWMPFGNAFGAGNRGVDLFFVLSGFIIAYVHGDDVGRPARLANYLFNRVTRIYPAVWILSALAIGVYAMGFGGADKAAKLAPGAIVASFLLLPQSGDALVNVTWTLTYEMLFYALFAVAIVNRRAGVALMLVWQTATAVAALSDIRLGPAGNFLRPLCLEFGLGLACAWWVRRADSAARPRVWSGLLAAGIVGFIAGMALDRAQRWAGVPCALGAGAIVVALVRLERAGTMRVPSLLVMLGGASYAIYLVHFSAITLFASVLARSGVPMTDMLCLVCAAGGVIAGLAFDRAADRPMQRWLHRMKPARRCLCCRNDAM